MPLQSIFDVLKQYNIVALQEDDTLWSGMLVGKAECGSDEAKNQVATMPIALTDEFGTFSKLNSMLVINWCTMPSGKYEITTYLS